MGGNVILLSTGTKLKYDWHRDSKSEKEVVVRLASVSWNIVTATYSYICHSLH